MSIPTIRVTGKMDETFILKIFNSVQLLRIPRDCPMGSTSWQNNPLAVQMQTRYEETIANTVVPIH
jgi:hypothetical protein